MVLQRQQDLLTFLGANRTLHTLTFNHDQQTTNSLIPDRIRQQCNFELRTHQASNTPQNSGCKPAGEQCGVGRHHFNAKRCRHHMLHSDSLQSSSFRTREKPEC